MEDRKKTTGSHTASANTHSSKGTHSSKSTSAHEGTMSHQESGHLGGVAPHSCRGRECNQSSSKSQSTGSTHRFTSASHKATRNDEGSE